DLVARGGAGLGDIARMLYHQPFTKMARKAHRGLVEHAGVEHDEALLESSFAYNRRLGNTYTASIYIALLALLDLEDDLAGERLGFFSYGSGAVSEFFTGIVRPGYREALDPARAARVLDSRAPIEVAEYR